MSMNEEQFIQRDRMRFTKNTLSSGLALLAILFNVFYFVSIYKSDVGSYYYNILIGASILYNLIFMLTVFLCSEGVKSYNKAYACVYSAILRFYPPTSKNLSKKLKMKPNIIRARVLM